MELSKNMMPDVLHLEMQAIRETGRDITLRQHLAETYSESLTNVPEGMELEAYISRLGVDMHKTTIAQFLNFEANRNEYYLFRELLLQAVVKGYKLSFDPGKLLAVSVDTTAQSVILPKYDFKEGVSRTMAEGMEVEPGVEFHEDYVVVGSKRIDLKKYGKKLPVTYETIKFLTFDPAAVYFQRIGSNLAIDRFLVILATMIYGDKGRVGNKIVAEPAPTIGVKSTEAGITYKDMLTGATRLGLRGVPTDSMIADEEQYIDTKCWDVFMKRETGTPFSKLEDEGVQTTPTKLYPSPGMIGYKRMLLAATAFCVGEFKSKGIMIEQQKDISRQIQNWVFSFYAAYGKMMPDTAILIDGTLDIATNGFPNWLEYEIPGNANDL